jgi:uncharacterized membrane protein YphA (DoxX/SURF4 family)
MSSWFAISLSVRPCATSATIANCVSVSSFGLGILLVLGATPRIIGAASAVTFGVFTLIVLWTWHRNTPQGCACFGSLLSERVSPLSILRNLILITLSCLVALAPRHVFTVVNDAGDIGVPLADLVPVLALVAGAILVYVQLVRMLGLETARTEQSAA